MQLWAACLHEISVEFNDTACDATIVGGGTGFPSLGQRCMSAIPPFVAGISMLTLLA